MPRPKVDTDIEFTITTDDDDWYCSELKIAGKVISTAYTGNFQSALDHFRDSFPEEREE